jgi:tetratricopeptide (TPR) repeat protein
MSSGNGSNGAQGAAIRDPETDKARLRAIHASLTAGDIDAAGKLAEDALADGIDHPMVLNMVAGRREGEGRFEESLELLLRAKAAAPEAIGIINAVGLCLIWLRRHEEAVAEFGTALALDQAFSPALANRGAALVALGRLVEARRDFEAALDFDPGNLIALNGLAALALRRGVPAEARRLALQVTARQPDYHEALTSLAGADIAEGKPGVGEQRLRVLLADPRVGPLDRAEAFGVLGDALDAEGRFSEAFEAYAECNRLRQEHYAAQFADEGTLGLVRALTGALEGKRVAATWGRAHESPARRHVFLVGFPRAGSTLIEQVLAGHPDVVTLAEKECLIDSARQWLADADDFERFCAAEDETLDSWRSAYWRRVSEAGVDPAGRVFVDKHVFNIFKLPLIARLFPEARILLVRRDPRDTVLSCFRSRFALSDPVYQMLTLDGAAQLYAATMELAEATERAFGLFVQLCALEAVIADFDTELRAICATLDIPWLPELSDFAAHAGDRGVATPGAERLAEGLNGRTIGRWTNYAGEMAPVLPILQPWVERGR